MLGFKFANLCSNIPGCRQQITVINIVLKILNQVSVRIIRHDYLRGSIDSTDKTRKSCSCTKLEHSLSFHKVIRMFL